MAIIRGAFGGAQIRNSLASVTFAQGPFGTVARARTPPVQPVTARKTAIQGVMSLVSNAWDSVLTQAQRDAWADYAAETPLPEPFGGTKILSGRQMYLRSNMIFGDALGTVQPAAPITPGVGRTVTITLGVTAANGVEILSLTPAIDVGSVVIVGIGRPVNQSRNFYKAPFTQVTVFTSATGYPAVIKAPGLVSAGQKYFVSVRRIETDGKVGELAIYSTLLA